MTLADVRLFTTLFSLLMGSITACSSGNRRRIQDYPQLSQYLRRIYRLPGVAATCDIEAVKQDYYGNLSPPSIPGGYHSGRPRYDLPDRGQLIVLRLQRIQNSLRPMNLPTWITVSRLVGAPLLLVAAAKSYAGAAVGCRGGFFWSRPAPTGWMATWPAA